MWSFIALWVLVWTLNFLQVWTVSNIASRTEGHCDEVQSRPTLWENVQESHQLQLRVRILFQPFENRTPAIQRTRETNSTMCWLICSDCASYVCLWPGASIPLKPMMQMCIAYPPHIPTKFINFPPISAIFINFPPIFSQFTVFGLI